MKTKPVIFYAEDDHDDQEIFQNALHDISHDADLYFQNDGFELLNDLRYQSVLPNLIFLDLNMPGRTGFHVLQEIREMEKYNQLPVIILSTTSDPIAVDRAKKLGANLFLTKPSCYTQFITLLKMVLSISWGNMAQAKPFYMNISQTSIIKA